MITVEFFSIPKRRAGVQQTTIDANGPMPLSELLAALATALPDFGEGCLDDAGQLQKHYLALLDDKRHRGDSMLLKAVTVVPNDSTVLSLSADAGG